MVQQSQSDSHSVREKDRWIIRPNDRPSLGLAASWAKDDASWWSQLSFRWYSIQFSHVFQQWCLPLHLHLNLLLPAHGPLRPIVSLHWLCMQSKICFAFSLNTPLLRSANNISSYKGPFERTRLSQNQFTNLTCKVSVSWTSPPFTMK